LVIKPTAAKGLGVFAATRIPARARVIDYIGKVSRQATHGEYVAEAGRKFARVYIDGSPALDTRICNGIAIGTHGQAKAAYINEPTPQQWANCKLVKNREQVYVRCCSPIGIAAGEELTMCYGRSFRRPYAHSHAQSRCSGRGVNTRSWRSHLQRINV